MASAKAIAAAVLAGAILLASVPVQAKLLRGYVKEDRELLEAEDLSHKQLTGSVRADSLPASYEGNWQCVTLVTDSAVASVEVGKKMVSEVRFQRQQDGRVVANWNQPGWTETQSNILTWSPTEGQVDRTTYYYGEGLNGSWAARTRDRFSQVAGNRILAQSYVDQYIDGQYLGRYRTKSVLVRNGTSSDLALLQR